MNAVATALARRIWPQWPTFSDRQQQALVAELLVILISLPLLTLSFILLVIAGGWEQFPAQWPFALLLVILSVLAGRISFFQIIGQEAGQYSYNSSDLVNVFAISGVLILGPLAIWAHLLGRFILFLSTWPRQGALQLRANWLRNLLFNLWTGNVSLLGGFAVYRYLGGQIPMPDLTFSSLGPAVALVLAEFLLSGILLFVLLWQQYTFRRRDVSPLLSTGRRSIIRFFTLAGVPSMFGILGAAIYAQISLGGYLFFAAAVLLSSFLARGQSQAAVLSQQRARQLGKLEELGRALTQPGVDMEQLTDTLRAYLPRMFDYDEAEVRLLNGDVLLQLPPGERAHDPRLWEWLQEATEPAAFLKGETLPWSRHNSNENYLLAPIRRPETDEPLGGVCLRTSSRFTIFGFCESLPSLQVLAAQIGSVLHRREAYEERLALERATQELALARQMQASFLPTELPDIPGWELEAMLAPARQTSGDFYDIISLTPDKLGLVVADVADKGMSAALFMALTRTLLRTYASDYPEDPARALRAANQRILSDTTDDSFVTVFYGVLDVQKGLLCYANAGHNPPYVMGDNKWLMLRNTGVPLGIKQDVVWTAAEIHVEPGDLLLLYTDGIIDAHNRADELFGAERLRQVVEACRTLPLAEMEATILREVRDFAGERPQFDDLTMLLARRLAA